MISGVNSSNQTIVLDAMTFHGNSGGPALEVTHEGLLNHFIIIGVVSQYVPVAEQWVNTTQKLRQLAAMQLGLYHCRTDGPGAGVGW